MKAPVFVLDANIFIEAARRYYAFDIAEGFWSGLQVSGEEGKIVSIDRVGAEIARGKDQLSRWCEDVFAEYFSSTDDDGVVSRYRDIVIWAQSQAQFTDSAKAAYMLGAHGRVVA